MRLQFAFLVVLVLFGSCAVPASAQFEEVKVRDRITINGDDQLTESSAVIGGSGTPDDPYLIAGWIILPTPELENSGLIHLQNTFAHVVIQNNEVRNPYSGCAILVENSANVVVRENLVSSNRHGVCVYDSELVVVDQNLLSQPRIGFDQLTLAIVVLRSKDAVVSSNHVEGFESGITVQQSCEGIRIEDNFLQNIGRYGAIEASWGCHNVEITGNRIDDVAGAGVQSYSSSQITIDRNQIRDVDFGFVINDAPREPAPSSVWITNNSVREFVIGFELGGVDITLEHNGFVKGEWMGWQRNLGGAAVFRYNDVDGVANGWVDLQGPLNATSNNFHEPIERLFDGSDIVDARHSWWGNISGPDASTIDGMALVDPWALEPLAAAGPR